MKLTRREFLRDTCGLIGASLIPAAFVNSCSQQAGPTLNPPTVTIPPSNLITHSSTGSPDVSSPSQSASGAFLYVPSREGLVLKQVPGCTSFVAMDRMYTVEHIWVKSIASDKVVLGITDKMQQLMLKVQNLQLPKEGEAVRWGEAFGYAEGNKMSTDLVAPVSGMVLQMNSNIWAIGGGCSGLDVITGDPYVEGWLIVVLLNKPEEMKQLITPEAYMALAAKTDGPKST